MVNIYPEGNAVEVVDALYITMVNEDTVLKENEETLEFIWMTPKEILEKINENMWHTAQVKTAKVLFDALLILPEIISLKEKQQKYLW